MVDDEEISSVKADVDMVHQQSQSLKIKISIGNTSIINSDRDQQLLLGSNSKQLEQQGRYEDIEEYAQTKKDLNLKLFSKTKANQFQEQTKTTAEIQLSQVLDMTAISYQSKTFRDDKKLKKQKKEKKVKKQINQNKKATKQKRKYTQRKSQKEKKPNTSKKSDLTKQKQLEQIKMIQELLEQNFIDQDKISTQATNLDARQNLVQVQPKDSKLIEIQEQSKLIQDLDPLVEARQAADKKEINKAKKTLKKRQSKPKASKIKEGKSQNENSELLQDKQNIEPPANQPSTPQHLLSKPVKQNLHKCDIEDCVRAFSTKQALSLHKSRTHKTKSQLSIKKAEHQSYKQIYKQIYPQDTRFNPIKLAELKEGMKIQS